MRPPEFTGGNMPASNASITAITTLSMRPPEFTGGNPPHLQERFVKRETLQ